jgi:hypothetical protein
MLGCKFYWKEEGSRVVLGAVKKTTVGRGAFSRCRKAEKRRKGGGRGIERNKNKKCIRGRR